ncbi:MAG: hypothetical protein ACRD4Q_02285 [Candidatus Acidiferrales bacterium]
MAGQRDSQREEHEFLRLLAQSALNDYPNPERIGCPGPEFLRTLAFHRKSIPLSDPRLHHVVHCSPCFREFTAFQAAARKRRNTLWGMVAAIAAVIAICVGLWASGTFNQLAPPGAASPAPIIAQIDLRNWSITRGAPEPSQHHGPIPVPRRRLQLTILLPFGSQAGTYQVQILKQHANQPLIRASGQAVIVDGITKLKVSLNTSSLTSGNFLLLGIRRPPLDWTSYPITIQ